MFEAKTQGIGDSVKVRVGFNLAKETPDLFKQAACKCVYMSIVYSLITTSIFLMMRGHRPYFFFASDQTLILLMSQIIPSSLTPID